MLDTVHHAGFAALLCFLCLAATTARAAERLAFVVGVDAYANLGPSAQLQRPVADARAVAAAAQRQGFRVTLLASSVTQELFLRRFGSFVEQVQPGDTAMVYFAGHGIALQGTNFLLPADIPAIEPGQEMLARSRAIAEADLSAALRERGARVVVMVIDACRDNPFPKNGTRSVGLGRGLTRVDPAEGVFSLYAAGAGQQALDRLPGNDADPNSVFTRVFVRQMVRPGLNLIDLGESVRDEVAKLAESVPHKQVPAYYNEVRGARFLSLAGPDAMPVIAPSAAPTSASGAASSPPPMVASRPVDPPPPQAILPGPTPSSRPERPVPSDRPVAGGPSSALSAIMNESAEAATTPGWVAPAPSRPKPSPPQTSSSPLSAAIDRPPETQEPQSYWPSSPSRPIRYGHFSHPTNLDPYGDNWVALRSLPSSREGVRLAKLGPDALFMVMERRGVWASVRLREGTVGWVHGDFIGCCRRAPLLPSTSGTEGR